MWSERFQRQTTKLQKVEKRAACVVLGEGFEASSNVCLVASDDAYSDTFPVWTCSDDV